MFSYFKSELNQAQWIRSEDLPLHYIIIKKKLTFIKTSWPKKTFLMDPTMVIWTDGAVWILCYIKLFPDHL